MLLGNDVAGTSINTKWTSRSKPLQKIGREEIRSEKVDRWLVVWFYGISTFWGYLMPSLFLYKSVLFQTIQFSISTHFSSIWPIDRTLSGMFPTQIAVSREQSSFCETSASQSLIRQDKKPERKMRLKNCQGWGTHQARVDLGVMGMKEYSVFPKAPALLDPHHQIV